MIKVAINILPLHTAHKVRGIGYYTRNLVDNLKKDVSLKVQEFLKLDEVKDADIVHYPWFDLFFHTLPIKKRFPTVVTIHDVIPLVFPEHYPIGLRSKINFFLQKISLQNCNFFITDSKTSKKDLIKYLKIKDEKIAIIPLAADRSFRILSDTQLIRIKRKYNLPEKFLLFVGDANWVKNLPFLIDGFKEIIKASGSDNLKLILVGGVFLKNVEHIDHPELQSLKGVNRKILGYKLEDKILRPGHLEDEELVAFYNLATIYVQPSLYEGFGLSLLQAFSCGTPVVSSNKGSLPEVGGNAAVYFDPNNIGQFKSIILEILKDKSLQNKLSKLGVEQAAKFSWDKVSNETKIVYEKVLQNGK